MVLLKWLDLGLRGLMETGIVVALGSWGWHTGHSPAASAAWAIGAPLLGFGCWSLIDFRRAGSWAEPLRLIQELAISGSAAVAWYVAGQQTLGWALGITSVLQHSLRYATGGRLLQPPPEPPRGKPRHTPRAQ